MASKRFSDVGSGLAGESHSSLGRQQAGVRRQSEYLARKLGEHEHDGDGEEEEEEDSRSAFRLTSSIPYRQLQNERLSLLGPLGGQQHAAALGRRGSRPVPLMVDSSDASSDQEPARASVAQTSSECDSMYTMLPVLPAPSSGSPSPQARPKATTTTTTGDAADGSPYACVGALLRKATASRTDVVVPYARLGLARARLASDSRPLEPDESESDGRGGSPTESSCTDSNQEQQAEEATAAAKSAARDGGQIETNEEEAAASGQLVSLI